MLGQVINPPACAYQLIAAIILSYSPNFHKEKWVHYFFEAAVALTVLLLLLFPGWGAEQLSPVLWVVQVLSEGWVCERRCYELVVWNKISHSSSH